MRRSTYWGLVLTGVATLMVLTANQSLNPLVILALWLAAVTAMATAVFERAKAVGKNPWLWLLLSLIPLMAIILGCLSDGVIPTPKPPKYAKTAGLSFAGAAAFLVAYVVVYSWAPTRDMVHEQLVGAVSDANASMPKQINEVTTLTAERVEGLRLVYVYELKTEGAVPPQANVAISVCKISDMRNAMAQGVSYGYEYRHAGKLLKVFDVTSCPASAPATTTAPLTNHSSVEVVLDGNRALVPLQVGSQSIYAMVDTGCSDMTVTESIADKLLAAGQATRIADADTTLADGSHKTVRAISINSVIIGGHGLYHVPAMVNPDGAIMLLGFAVLNQVSGKFAINTARSTLEFD